MKTIRNHNKKGQQHGYQERYWDNKLSYRGNTKNNKSIKYTEYHLVKRTRFYIS
jgi:hypothetical protein